MARSISAIGSTRSSATTRPVSVFPFRQKPPAPPDASALELLDHLRSPDRWTRRFAKRVLADRPAEQVTAAFEKWISRPDLSERALAEALGVYQSHEVVAE